MGIIPGEGADGHHMPCDAQSTRCLKNGSKKKCKEQC